MRIPATLLSAIAFCGAVEAAEVSPPAAPSTDDPANTATMDGTDETQLPSYERIDANGDGIVTLPEITVYAHPLTAQIRACDTNQDGSLSRAEHVVCRLVAPPPATPAAH